MSEQVRCPGEMYFVMAEMVLDIQDKRSMRSDFFLISIAFSEIKGSWRDS